MELCLISTASLIVNVSLFLVFPFLFWRTEMKCVELSDSDDFLFTVRNVGMSQVEVTAILVCDCVLLRHAEGWKEGIRMGRVVGRLDMLPNLKVIS